MSVNWTNEQVEALEFDDIKGIDNKVVLASAGSGKTTVMVEKILKYIDKGGSVLKIIVSTFTNSSAGDMQDKIVDSLKDRIRNNTNHKMTDHYRRQIADLQLAYIGTIDSFCNTILQRHYEEIGASPLLTILSGAEEDNLFYDVVHETILEILKNKNQEYMELLSNYSSGRTFSAIIKAISNIRSFLNAIPNPYAKIDEMIKETESVKLENKTVGWLLNDIKREAKIVFDLVEQKLNLEVNEENTDYNTYITIKEMSEKILTGETSVDSVCKVLSYYEYYREDFGRAKGECGKLASVLNSFFDIFDGGYEKCKQDELLGRKNAKVLLDLTRLCLQKFEERKKMDTVVTFSDVERLALNILSNGIDENGKYIPSIVAESIKKDIEYIFVDEYQDINLLQNSILDLVAKDNIFMVGDIKQSIYSFRHSMPDIMKGINDDIEKEKIKGKSISFNSNYRSHPQILNFVNTIFSKIMTEAFGKVQYNPKAIMKEGDGIGWEEENNVVTIKKLENPRSEKPIISGVFSVKEAPYLSKSADSEEAIWVAKAIQDLVNNHQIYDLKLKQYRNIEYRDIAIIKRKNTTTPRYAKQLSKLGIPHELVGSFVDLNRQDIDLFNSLIKVISNPKQDYPLMAVMTSFFGKFTVDDILDLKEDGLSPDKTCADFGKIADDSTKEEEFNKGKTHTDFGKIADDSTKEEEFNKDKTRADFGKIADDSTKEEEFNKGKTHAGFYKQAASDNSVLKEDKSSKDKTPIGNIIEERKGETLYDILTNSKNSKSSKVKEFLDLIDRYRTLAPFVSVADLMIKIATETGYDAEMLSAQDERIASFNSYIHYLRDKDFAKNIETYIEWVNKDSEIELKLPSAGANAVRIGTIHGSKGLEYPIVFVTDCHDWRDGQDFTTAEVILADKDIGAGFKVIDSNKKLTKTLSYWAIERKADFLGKEEKLRVLYVALTRAKNRLFVTSTSKDKDNLAQDPSLLNCFIDLIDFARYPGNAVDSAYDNYEPPEIEKTNEQMIKPEIDCKDSSVKLGQYQYPYISATKVSNKYTATEIAMSSYLEMDAENDYSEYIPEIAGASIEKGVRYHAIMQHIDFKKKSKSEVKEQIDEILKLGILGDKTKREDIDDGVILKALNNPVFEKIKEMQTLREKAFQLYLPHKEIYKDSDVTDKILVQGVIDLIAIKDGNAILVDYKHSGAPIEDIKKRYIEQIRIYTMAIEKLLKLKLEKKIIYLLERDEIIEF